MEIGELYALPPEEFTAARDAAAKQARAGKDSAAAAALKALRRPSVAAWLVNRLSQEQTELLGQLLALGPALAQAQAGGHAEDLRALGKQRRELVEAVADSAVASAGRAVGGPVRDEVVSTLEAALADPGSAGAVRSGRLVRALAYAGFGEVDLSGAVAATPAPPVPSKKAGRARLEPRRRPRPTRLQQRGCGSRPPTPSAGRTPAPAPSTTPYAQQSARTGRPPRPTPSSSRPTSSTSAPSRRWSGRRGPWRPQRKRAAARRRSPTRLGQRSGRHRAPRSRRDGGWTTCAVGSPPELPPASVPPASVPGQRLNEVGGGR